MVMVVSVDARMHMHPHAPLVLAQVFNQPKAVLLKPKLLMGVANWMGERIKRNHVRQEDEDNSYEGKDDY